MSGGSLMIRPSAVDHVVSLSRAWRLSRVRALATICALVAHLLVGFAPVGSLPPAASSSARTRLTSMWEYQTSSVDIPASRAISWR